MKILLLEDEGEKRSKIKQALSEMVSDLQLTEVDNWYDYSRKVDSLDFDLILLDLLVPRSARDPKVEDHCIQLIETTRGHLCRSFRTPAIVITQYLDKSEDFFRDLNKADINVISFDDSNEWRASLEMKVLAARPKVKFDFIVLCALNKEAEAYDGLADEFHPLKTISGLSCREIKIGDYRGAIVILPRMGLVTTGVISSLAIERFEPKLVCMSGICGGIPNGSKIYDILITEICHQHDVGKWTNEGFKAEHYDIQINSAVRNKLEELRLNRSVLDYVKSGVTCQRSEFPDDTEAFEFELRLVATSSGSAVIAEEGKTASLNEDQRKLAGFDMEIYSVYEAARLSERNPKFFAVKSVVDDGGTNKGDRFHRIGCLLSAKFVISAIKSGMLDS
jgi:nucleoside phosphorylase